MSDDTVESLQIRIKELESALNCATNNLWSEWEIEKATVKSQNIHLVLRIIELEDILYNDITRKPPQEREYCKGCSLLSASTERDK